VKEITMVSTLPAPLVHNPDGLLDGFSLEDQLRTLGIEELDGIRLVVQRGGGAAVRTTLQRFFPARLLGRWVARLGALPFRPWPIWGPTPAVILTWPEDGDTMRVRHVATAVALWRTWITANPEWLEDRLNPLDVRLTAPPEPLPVPEPVPVADEALAFREAEAAGPSPPRRQSPPVGANVSVSVVQQGIKLPSQHVPRATFPAPKPRPRSGRG
jgi:hypothetical protein